MLDFDRVYCIWKQLGVALNIFFILVFCFFFYFWIYTCGNESFNLILSQKVCTQVMACLRWWTTKGENSIYVYRRRKYYENIYTQEGNTICITWWLFDLKIFLAGFCFHEAQPLYQVATHCSDTQLWHQFSCNVFILTRYRFYSIDLTYFYGRCSQ